MSRENLQAGQVYYRVSIRSDRPETAVYIGSRSDTVHCFEVGGAPRYVYEIELPEFYDTLLEALKAAAENLQLRAAEARKDYEKEKTKQTNEHGKEQ